MILKCKICGGDLEVNTEDKLAVCSYCGRTQTLPRLDDERRLNLYDRANHFRRNNEYDKAMGIYETILSEDGEDAEAYWSLLLCKYGVEYVKDPASGRWLPTCNRTSSKSVLADEDYKAAVRYAGTEARALYEEEALKLEEIQKNILAISAMEEAYDIFICYKESDEQGRRTRDSVMAQDIYQQLTKEGYRVFFARISLEDKVGSAYEPYIYAALSSAKVMLVVGTSDDYFNAVWVKNEWSRFLVMMKEDNSKLLIPVYRDMDPYDLPVELSHLQAQDMGKIGFIQDLLHGLSKVFEKNKNDAVMNVQRENYAEPANVENLIRRIEAFLEEGNFEKAQEYCEKVLDIKIDEPKVYMAQLRVEYSKKYKIMKYEKDIVSVPENITLNRNFICAKRYADKKYIEVLDELQSKNEEYCFQICEHAFEGKKEIDYSHPLNLIKQFLDTDSDGRWNELYKEMQEVQHEYITDTNALAKTREEIKHWENAVKEKQLNKLELEYNESKFRYDKAQNDYMKEKSDFEYYQLRLKSIKSQISSCNKWIAGAWIGWILVLFIGAVFAEFVKELFVMQFFGTAGLILAIILSVYNKKKIGNSKDGLYAAEREVKAGEARVNNCKQDISREKNRYDYAVDRLSNTKNEVDKLQEVLSQLSQHEEELLIKLNLKKEECHGEKATSNPFEEGVISQAEVVAIAEYGAVIKLSDGQQGFLHISKISDRRINRVEQVLKVGQTVTVVSLGKDKLGRPAFSMKDVKNYK